MSHLQTDTERIDQMLRAGKLDEVEQWTDELDLQDHSRLAERWGIPEWQAPMFRSAFYSNTGLNWYRVLKESADHERHKAALEERAPGFHGIYTVVGGNMERCFEKAFNVFGMAADDVMYYPSNAPHTDSFIFALGGLGLSKYFVGKEEESKKYLRICLRLRAQDARAVAWQGEVSYYMRFVNRKPVQIALRAEDVMPNLFDHQLLKVSGELLEWDEYAKPTQKIYAVRISDEDIDWLEAAGYRNAIALEGHVLVLESDVSGDLQRPLRIKEVV